MYTTICHELTKILLEMTFFVSVVPYLTDSATGGLEVRNHRTASQKSVLKKTELRETYRPDVSSAYWTGSPVRFDTDD